MPSRSVADSAPATLAWYRSATRTTPTGGVDGRKNPRAGYCWAASGVLQIGLWSRPAAARRGFGPAPSDQDDGLPSRSTEPRPPAPAPGLTSAGVLRPDETPPFPEVFDGGEDPRRTDDAPQ